MTSQAPHLSEPPCDIPSTQGENRTALFLSAPHHVSSTALHAFCVELRLERQKDLCGVQASLGYIVNPCFKTTENKPDG